MRVLILVVLLAVGISKLATASKSEEQLIKENMKRQQEIVDANVRGY